MEQENILANLDGLDFPLVEATLESIKTGKLTPIIKQELKLKIQSNRLLNGKQELPKAEFKPPEACKLTEEEERKRKTRRERNREAAQRCRNKKKNQDVTLRKEYNELQKKNRHLKELLRSLENEKQELMEKYGVSPGPVAQHTPRPYSPFSPIARPASAISPHPGIRSPSTPDPSESSTSWSAPSQGPASFRSYWSEDSTGTAYSPPQLTTRQWTPAPKRVPECTTPEPSCSVGPDMSGPEDAFSPVGSEDQWVPGYSYDAWSPTSFGPFQQRPCSHAEDTDTDTVAPPSPFSLASEDEVDLSMYLPPF